MFFHKNKFISFLEIKNCLKKFLYKIKNVFCYTLYLAFRRLNKADRKTD